MDSSWNIAVFVWRAVVERGRGEENIIPLGDEKGRGERRNGEGVPSTDICSRPHSDVDCIFIYAETFFWKALKLYKLSGLDITILELYSK